MSEPAVEASRPRVSIVIPVHDEGERVNACLDRILEAVTLPCEILVVYDTPDDRTVPHLRRYAACDSRVRPVHNTRGRGPANAIRSGFAEAHAPVVVVTMADGSDDAMQIDTLTRLVERGVVIAAASRYSRAGQQVGAPPLKATLSRLAGLTLFHAARVGTHDATNSFKAYSAEFIRCAGVESDQGFELGIELVAKARRARLPVAEIPTIWLERNQGTSNFRLAAWTRHYLRWYLYAFGPRRQLVGFVPGPIPTR